MPRALTSVRLDEHAKCKYVLFVEGLSRAWTNDAEGAITGSGLGTWIYNSEVAIGGREIAGTRSVGVGLVLPESVSFAIDPKTGEIEPSPMTFEILDEDGTLADLFATEGQTASVLYERVAPGVADLGTSLDVAGGLTINPRGRYIGIEKIGPDGERRQWPAIPFDLVGYDHPVHAGAEPPAGLPPVLVSTNPLEFAGRMVTLYRIYRDPDDPNDDADSYYTWDEAHDAGDLVWWGVMRDAGRVAGSGMWAIDCHGPEALLRKTLGTRNTVVRTRLAASLSLSADENRVAIGFASRGVAGPSVETYYDASLFDHSITATSRAALATQLNGWIESVIDGSDAPFPVGAGGYFDTWVDAEGLAYPDAGITQDGRIFIRREAKDVNDDLTYGVMYIAMHSRAWRCLGFEPETQHRDGPTFDDKTHVRFRWLTSGEQLKYGVGTGVDVPGDGYVLGMFTTITCGYPPEDIEAYDNDGGPRHWLPYHTSEVFVLDRHGQQVVRALDEEPTSLYLEGQLTCGYSQSSTISSDRARWFLISGEVVQVDDDPSTDEVEVTDAVMRHQVARLSWAEGANYGTVSEGAGVEPLLFVEQYLDPRSFGLNNAPLTHDWAGKVSGKGEITLTPLNTYHYFIEDAPFEQADTILAQIMLSTGACTGYDAALDDDGAITAGPNTHPLAVDFAGDYELADLGLGIPYQLVAHPAQIRSAFTTLPGNYDGDLCRLRLAYAGPFQSDDVLSSILRPRLLCWSLAGKEYGVFRLGPVSPQDADMTITEDDLAGEQGDPTTTIPSQSLRATGQLDGIRLSYRWDPDGTKTAIDWSLRALDAGAARRTGDKIEDIVDHGLCPIPWFGGKHEAITGVGDWRPLARQLWQRDAPAFFARRHYSVTLSLSPPKGQDAMPGTAIAITNPWPVDPSGGYGITAATGRILRATHYLRAERTEIEALVFAGDSSLHYAPFVRVRRVAGTTVEWYPDTLGHGGDTPDGLGFAEPSWSSVGGGANVYLYQRIGETWSLVGSGTVATVDTTTYTLTTTAGLTGWLRDCDHYLVVAAIGDQDAGEFPTELFGPQADADLTIGDATTPAAGFVQ